MTHEAEATDLKVRVPERRPAKGAVSARASGDGTVTVRSPNADTTSLAKVLMAAAKLAVKVGDAAAIELLRTAQGVVSRRKLPSASVRRHDGRRELEQAERWLKLRTEFLEANATVTASELARLTGSQSSNPSARAHDWLKAGRVFSVNDGSRERFPLFQLHEGQPIPAVADVLQLLRTKLSEWQIAFWFTTPNAWTGQWRAPCEILARDPELVLEAARHEVTERVL